MWFPVGSHEGKKLDHTRDSVYVVHMVSCRKPWRYHKWKMVCASSTSLDSIKKGKFVTVFSYLVEASVSITWHYSASFSITRHHFGVTWYHSASLQCQSTAFITTLPTLPFTQLPLYTTSLFALLSPGLSWTLNYLSQKKVESEAPLKLIIAPANCTF